MRELLSALRLSVVRWVDHDYAFILMVDFVPKLALEHELNSDID